MKILPMYPSLYQGTDAACLAAVVLLRDTLDSPRYQPGLRNDEGSSRFFCNVIAEVYKQSPELYPGVSVYCLQRWVQACVDVLLVQQTGGPRRELEYTLNTTLSKISQAQQVEFHNTAYSYGQFARLFFAELIDHAEACRLEGV